MPAGAGSAGAGPVGVMAPWDNTDGGRTLGNGATTPVVLNGEKPSRRTVLSGMSPNSRVSLIDCAWY